MCFVVTRNRLLSFSVKFHSNERHLIWALISFLKNKTKWKWRSLWRNCTRQRWCSDFCPSNVTVWTLEKKTFHNSSERCASFCFHCNYDNYNQIFLPLRPGFFWLSISALFSFFWPKRKNCSIPSHPPVTATSRPQPPPHTQTGRQTGVFFLFFLSVI